MRRTFVQFATAAILLVLLAVLGTLQYRWLGEVGAAERERLRTTLRTRASDFSRDFDREITRTYLAFRADPDLFKANAAEVLAAAYTRAQAESAIGGIIKTVYFVELEGPRKGALQQLDPAAQTLAPVEWPQEFDAWRRRALGLAPPIPGLGPLLVGDAIDAGIPAMLVSLPPVKRIESGGHVAIVHDTDSASRMAILRLDRDRVQRQLLEALVARHFGAANESEYFVSIVTRDPSPRVVYSSTRDVTVTPSDADVASPMFDLRLDELRTFMAKAPLPGAGRGVLPEMKDRVAVTIVRRADGDAARIGISGPGEPGAWQVLVRGKAGSLEWVVSRSRNRNLAVGLGILALLAASLVFVIASAQRQHRLARQQLEFVAAVSHELRTPLAVIRSAGENLADGVVGDREQVKKYGSLIRTEGRRLSDMVERVLEFAGMSSAAAVRARTDVDVTRVVDEAIAGVMADANDRRVAIAARVESGLPPIAGDPEALRAAVQNVVGNAVKYSASGGTVEVEAGLDRDRLRIAVIDRGIGIDASDLPHVFKPFYRGRRAVDAQIRGTGVGLAVVRHVVEAHQGEVRIDSDDVNGTRVVMTFPAAARRDGYMRGDATARAAT